MNVLKGMLKPAVKTSKGISYGGNSDGKADNDRQGTDFRDWLLGLGAVEVKDQGPWFDKEGWFDIEPFYKQLSESKGYCIDSLKDASARTEWGERLRQVVFHKDTGILRLFDASPQAMLVRCLTPPQPSIHAGVEIEGPSFAVVVNFFRTPQSVIFRPSAARIGWTVNSPGSSAVDPGCRFSRCSP